MNDNPYKNYPGLEGLIVFHGHICPGLAIGYRATLAGLERLGVERAEDEELIAIVENDSCSVDAAQFLAGATFGKGNFFFHDYGKQVFTFARRDDSHAVRVSLKPDRMGPPPEKTAEWRQERIDFILDSPLEDLLTVSDVEIELPPPATIRRSIICESCGEPVMETRTITREEKTICRDCAGPE
ncbi:MAG: FmdE family protein [Thermoleophilia bacterium]|nr:FmdE family protein [Thermoleophilia bacterium]